MTERIVSPGKGRGRGHSFHFFPSFSMTAECKQCVGIKRNGEGSEGERASNREKLPPQGRKDQEENTNTVHSIIKVMEEERKRMQENGEQEERSEEKRDMETIQVIQRGFASQSLHIIRKKDMDRVNSLAMDTPACL